MIKKYFIYRKLLFVFYIFTIVLLSIMEYVNNIQITTTVYNLLVFSFICIVIWIIDFYKFKEKFENLEEICNNLSYFEHNIPKDDNAIENKYNEIIRGLYENIKENEQLLISKNVEKENYYTLWMHQIKTPISVICLMLDNNKIDKKILEEEIFNIERYVEMALHYIKLDDLANDLVLEKLSIKSLVKECVKKYANIFIYKKIKITISENDVILVSDKKWLSFIIEQILSNALKYTSEKGCVNIIICGGKYPVIKIKDNGIGIKKEDIPRVFEKGYTGTMGRIEKKASGIGLFLSREICKVLGIEITIHSKTIIGTEVKLRFPMNKKKIYE